MHTENCKMAQWKNSTNNQQTQYISSFENRFGIVLYEMRKGPSKPIVQTHSTTHSCLSIYEQLYMRVNVLQLLRN